MKKVSDCVQSSETKTSFSVKEKGKTFTLTCENEFKCDIIAVDKCVFEKSPLKRCDFLFIIPKGTNIVTAKAYYVELKGDDLKEACEQLWNAIERTKNEILNHQIEARVISTKGSQPQILNGAFYRKVRKIIKKEIVFCKVHKGNNFNHRESLV